MLTILMVMLAILATWGAAAVILIGIGLLVRGFARVEERSTAEPEFLGCFWVGFAVLVLLLQTWHFALPIDWRAAAATSVSGIVGLAVGRQWVRQWLATVGRARAAAVLSLVAWIWLANRAVGPPGAFDSGVYHIPAVEWATAHAIVPGLGNLHGRLGFNNSSLLYTALLDIGPWRHRSEHLANGLLLAALMVQIIFACIRLARGHGWSASDAFLAVLLLPCLYLATDPTNLNMASPTTDGAVIIMTFVSAACCVSVLAREGYSGGAIHRALTGALLMVAGMTTKLTTIAYSAMGWLLLAAWWMRTPKESSGGRTRRAGVLAISLAAAMAGTWVARGIVLSGYPAFPMRVGAVNVDWRVPEERAQAYQREITLYARDRDPLGSDETGLDEPWIRAWARNVLESKFEVALPLTLCGLGLAAIVLVRGWWRRGLAARDYAGAWWLGLPIIAGLVLWFVMAPHPRYALHLAWSLAGLCIAMGVMELRVRLGERWAGMAVLGLSCVMTAGMLAVRTVKQIRRRGVAPLQTLVIGPGPDHGLHPAPELPLMQQTTRWGLVVYCPVTDRRVFHAPLLTTPEFDERLQLRIPGNEAGGFRCAE